MNAMYIPNCSVAELKKSINSYMDLNQSMGLILLTCDANNYSVEDVGMMVNDLSIPVFGGVFPGVVYGNQSYQEGSILLSLDKTPSVSIVKGLDNENLKLDKSIQEISVKNNDIKTIFVFVDAFTHHMSELMESLFMYFGLDVNYIGGGAGSLDLKSKPCLITNEGLIQHAAIIATTNIEAGIGVRHGWTSISGPYKITSSDGNVIKTINFKPAFQLYQKIVESHSGQILTKENFFDIAKAYPFGISKFGSEKVVRDPVIANENDELICVGEVQQGSYVDVLNGNTQTLIKSANEAFLSAIDKLGKNKKRKTTFLIDCISRVLFLEDKYPMELKAIHDNNTELVGALTIGEIANNGNEYLDFYNKTIVVCCI